MRPSETSALVSTAGQKLPERVLPGAAMRAPNPPGHAETSAGRCPVAPAPPAAPLRPAGLRAPLPPRASRWLRGSARGALLPVRGAALLPGATGDPPGPGLHRAPRDAASPLPARDAAATLRGRRRLPTATRRGAAAPRPPPRRALPARRAAGAPPASSRTPSAAPRRRFAPGPNRPRRGEAPAHLAAARGEPRRGTVPASPRRSAPSAAFVCAVTWAAVRDLSGAPQDMP